MKKLDRTHPLLLSVLFMAFLGVAVILVPRSQATQAQEDGTRLEKVAGSRPEAQPPQQPQSPVGSGFTYQGQLKDGGNPANGQYDFIFTLYDAEQAGNQVGSPITRLDQTVANGIIAQTLDFGAGTFQGEARWLDVQVRQSGGGSYATLSPRQAITAVPNALSLVPGAVIAADLTDEPALVVTNTDGVGVKSASTYADGVFGTSTWANGVYGGSGWTGVRGEGGNYGVHGISSSIGVRGEGGNYGVHGISSSIGVFGESSGAHMWGVYGLANNGEGAVGVYGVSANGNGVYGVSGSGNGVLGTSNSDDGVSGSSESGHGVRGYTNNGGGAVAGVFAESRGSQGNGVIGEANIGTQAYGVWGRSTSGIGVRGDSAGGYGVGVYGYTNQSTGISVYGLNESPSGYGVLGVANGDSARGVVAQSSGGIGIYSSGGDHAGWFQGTVNVTGYLYKSGGGFKIDHPLDPENKYLYHSFVESPDMKNIYDGNVTTDANGEAVVALPEWFEAVNKDFRYQLTPLGQFAQAIVSTKIKNNRFTIKTDKPNVEVSWQVTGIRKDAYAQANRIPVEEAKQGAERGKYRHSEAHGQPESKGIGYEERQGMQQAHRHSKELVPPPAGRDRNR